MHTLTKFVFLCLPLLSFAEESLAKTASSTNRHHEAKRPFFYFTPPSEWQIADPKLLSPRVHIGFLGKNRSGFCPSMNMATEEVDVSLSEYVAAVKKIHQLDRTNEWRDLGKFQTAGGEGRLTEIHTKTEWGLVRMFQLLLVRDSTAYIVTAAALKEEFSELYLPFQKAFKSLTFVADLYDAISDEARREQLKTRVADLQASFSPKKGSSDPFLEKEFQDQRWLPFQKKFIQDFSDLGAHWQILFLQKVEQDLLARAEP